MAATDRQETSSVGVAIEQHPSEEVTLRQLMGASLAHQAAITLLLGIAAKSQKPELGEQYFGSLRKVVESGLSLDAGLYVNIQDDDVREGYLSALDFFADTWANISTAS